LRQEPQAKYSPLPVPVTVNDVFEAKIVTSSNVATVANLTNPALATKPNVTAQPNLNSASANLAAAPSELATAESSSPIIATQIKATPTGANANPLPLDPSIAVQQKLNAAYNTMGSATLDLSIADLNASTTQRPEQAVPATNNAPQAPLKGDAALPAQAALPATTTTESSAANNASAKPEAVSSLPAPVTRANEQANMAPQPGNPIPRELTPIVQQQLDGLANQNFAWQGQVWPGQQMQWEIGENPANPRGQDAEIAQWQTRLKLSLPMLGGIDATLQLRPNGEVGISINTDSPASEAQLKEHASQLRSQFESAGLSLSKLFIQHAQTGE
jgi:hypothetical protein